MFPGNWLWGSQVCWLWGVPGVLARGGSLPPDDRISAPRGSGSQGTYRALGNLKSSWYMPDNVVGEKPEDI